MGLRQYDPATGRWLTRDPIGYSGGLNLYAYCDGDPVNLADPMGLDAEFGRMGNGDDPWGEKLAARQGVDQGLERARNDPRFAFAQYQCPGSDTNDPNGAVAMDNAGQSIHNAAGIIMSSGGMGFVRRASNPLPEDGIFANEAIAKAEAAGYYPAEGQRPVDWGEAMSWANRAQSPGFQWQTAEELGTSSGHIITAPNGFGGTSILSGQHRILGGLMSGNPVPDSIMQPMRSVIPSQPWNLP